ncbi:response regulator [Streptomyces sp. WI03-4A]|uniref:response regulator n=1 Tax=Streptomyces sp. WI03-4A TaxID=3028706 RepID=UPI0029A10B69|nr:response regulator [Streptomyces sp. WI03-4A]MDX2595919.1 response regulator [Streptomyces sp. WI03-4A]
MLYCNDSGSNDGSVETANLILNYVKALAWPAVALFVVLRYQSHIGALIPRIKSLSTPAGSVEFAEEARALLDQAEAATNVTVPASTRRGALRRLEHAAGVLDGGKILWVDDHPENNTPLIELFRATGMEVDTALSTDEALINLRRHSYDIILSDIGRTGDPQAGITLLDELDQLGIDTPVVLYTAWYDDTTGTPRRAFAVTEVPDEVVHYVIDLMERVKLS